MGTTKQCDIVQRASPWPSTLDQSGNQSVFDCRNVMSRPWVGWVAYSQRGTRFPQWLSSVLQLYSHSASGLLNGTHFLD